MLLKPAQIKPKSFESRWNFFFFTGVDASHVYVRGWALGCFQSYQYPNLSEGIDHTGVQLRRDEECPFSGITKSGRVWRKVLENGAQSLYSIMTPTLNLRTALYNYFIIVLIIVSFYFHIHTIYKYTYKYTYSSFYLLNKTCLETDSSCTFNLVL